MPIVEPAPGVLTKVVLSVVLAAGGVAIAHLAPPPTPPYKMVDDLMDDPKQWRGDTVRVHGWVAPGSIERAPAGGRDFVLQKSGARLRVHFEGVVPDTFKDQSELVVNGVLQRDERGWIIDGDQLYAKCATKYDGNLEKTSTKFQ
jgi:cytochrome c-type biogenesis protein CcmE